MRSIYNVERGSLYEDINWPDCGISSDCIYLYLSENQKEKEKHNTRCCTKLSSEI